LFAHSADCRPFGDSAILRRLAAYPRQNALAKVLEKSVASNVPLFTLNWIRDPAYRLGEIRASSSSGGLAYVLEQILR
jgi:TnpA family transposase